REILKTGSTGFGDLAFAALAQQQMLRANTQAAGPLAPKAPHFTQPARPRSRLRPAQTEQSRQLSIAGPASLRHNR
ncbi:MAG: hypothetical protein ACK5DR_17260, partial [Planctomyces sp.]